MKQPRTRRNNYYILINKDNEWWDFSSENSEYFLSQAERKHFDEIPENEMTRYNVKDYTIYIILEPASDMKERINSQVRLLRNLPKHFREIRKWDLEGVIKMIKS